MFSIQHRITIGGASLRSGESSGLLDLETYASLRSPVNRCALTLPASSAPAAALGDAVAIDLGYGDKPERIFTGAVTACAAGLGTVRIEAFGAAQALTRLFHNAVYEQQAAGAIAGDILSRADLRRGAVDDGVTFSSYVFGANRSLAEQLAELARRCGFDCYADRDDAIVFAAYDPQRTHDLAYGRELLAFEATPLAATVEGVEVYGASPAGQGQSEEASSWLTKKEVKGAAGASSGNLARVADPAARTQDQAKLLAGNLFAALKRTAAGRARLLGAPTLALGDAVRFADLPHAVYNAIFRLTSVRHRLNRRIGFVTEIAWEGR